MGQRLLYDFEQKQNEDDGKDQRDASTAVVSEPWSHAIPAESEHKYQNDQKDKHLSFLRSAKSRH